MRRVVVALALMLALPSLPSLAAAQAAGKFPPDSLVNTKVFPHNTPVTQVLGAMRNFAGDLGVRCSYCHVEKEGQPLSQVDFPSDEKRTKRVARQMMLMVQEINRRVDTLPERVTTPTSLRVTCGTCHRGVTRPAPLAMVLTEVASTAGADSAVRTYKALRTRYYGRSSYDFGEGSLTSAALTLAQQKKFDEAFALLKLNEENFPGSSPTAVTRGNVSLLRGDTAAAEAAFREAIKRDSTNQEAKGRLRAIGKQP